MSYRAELHAAMLMLARDERVIFMGQAVRDRGTFMSSTFEGIDVSRLIELPVAEEMQLGMALGMAIRGAVPVCVYPRWNFLLLAMNQLVNHLDKAPEVFKWWPKVLVRVGIGPDGPVHPGPQHVGDFTEAMAKMVLNTRVVTVRPGTAIESYRYALQNTMRSSIMVEDGRLYGAA